MKTRYFRLAVVGALLLITQAIPDVPAVALAQFRAPPRVVPVRPSGGVRVRGGGCSGGGARLVPKVPSAAPKVAPRAVPKVLPDPKVPLPARLAGQRELLHAHASARDWALLGVAASAGRAELPPVVGRHLEVLEANANGLKALGRLRDLVHGPWPKDVPAEEVAAGVAAFETASPQDAPALRHYLALRAEMEGQPAVAQKLLPPDEALDARSVLRDLKVLEEISATPPPISPLGDMPLPEPEPLSLKPPVREAINKDMPGLGDVKDLPDAELRARRGALRAIETRAGMRWNRVVLSLHNLKGVTANDTDDREAEVERQLGRSVTPEERLLVRRLLRTKTTAEVVVVLLWMGHK
jgi:hypothetical protein